MTKYSPVSFLHKSIAGCFRPVRVADGPITARYRFIKNVSWLILIILFDNPPKYNQNNIMTIKGWSLESNSRPTIRINILSLETGASLYISMQCNEKLLGVTHKLKRLV